jgi:ATP-dependent exoDNAse (exonuclease V) alpha subunit
VTDAAGKSKTLAATQRVFQRGYAVTSYASQGKTVDAVILADAANRAATNAQQWYVAISRGRKRVVVFTSDKEELKSSIDRSGERELAVDLKTTISAALRTHVSDWTRRVMEASERHRLHQAVMNRVRPPAQRISL